MFSWVVSMPRPVSASAPPVESASGRDPGGQSFAGKEPPAERGNDPSGLRPELLAISVSFRPGPVPKSSYLATSTVHKIHGNRPSGQVRRARHTQDLPPTGWRIPG